MMKNCYKKDNDAQAIFLRVNGEWVRYQGTTSLRKIYYRFYEAMKSKSSKVWVYEYEHCVVDGAMFPVDFHRSLSCVSIDGIPCHALPHRIVLEKKLCKVQRLGNGCGNICTYCGELK